MYARTRGGGRRDPRRARWLIDAMGVSLPGAVVRVVGTNGKGTVATMIARGLTASGTTTGLFVSPHVEDFSERVSVDGVPIASEEVVDFVRRVRERLESAPPPPGLRPGFFEVTLAMALDCFDRRGARWAVLEAGIGGATDATAAAVGPGTLRLVALTNVDVDHLGTIGPTLEDVAREKAGAFAAGVPAATTASGIGLEVARRTAERVGAPLVEVAPLGRFEATRSANSRLATAALAALGIVGGPAAAAVAAPVLPARGERFAVDGRTVVLDGAHDPAAAGRLSEEIGGGYALVFGALGRKQGQESLTRLAPRAGSVILTEAEEGEGTEHLTWEGAVVVPDPVAAVRTAVAATPRGGTVVVAGSLHLAGRVRPWLRTADTA